MRIIYIYLVDLCQERPYVIVGVVHFELSLLHLCEIFMFILYAVHENFSGDRSAKKLDYIHKDRSGYYRNA